MMEIKDLPDDVLGILAYGTISEEDYKKVLVPATEKKLARHKRIKMLFQLADMDGIEPAAVWEDTKFGVQHWTEFSHIALVTDNDWIKAMTLMFSPFFPGQIKLFGANDAEKAREWIIAV